MTSSAIQSDQAVSRQLTSAASNLAETADKAISGAESAAQASRVAVDAVRGISTIAQQISESQSRVERTLATQVDASGQLVESLRASTTSSQTTARTLNDIGSGLARLREEFDRISTQTGQQANALNGLLAQQADVAKDISQVARELGSVGLTTAQRQREVNQDFQHLVQRLDGLANTLNRLVQQTPSAENLQQAFTTAVRAELARLTPESETGPRWGRPSRT